MLRVQENIWLGRIAGEVNLTVLIQISRKPMHRQMHLNGLVWHGGQITNAVHACDERFDLFRTINRIQTKATHRDRPMAFALVVYFINIGCRAPRMTRRFDEGETIATQSHSFAVSKNKISLNPVILFRGAPPHGHIVGFIPTALRHHKGRVGQKRLHPRSPPP